MQENRILQTLRILKNNNNNKKTREHKAAAGLLNSQFSDAVYPVETGSNVPGAEDAADSHADTHMHKETAQGEEREDVSDEEGEGGREGVCVCV